MNCLYRITDDQTPIIRQQCLFGWITPDMNRFGLINDGAGKYY